MADVAFNDLVHQAIDGSPGGRNELQHVCAFLLRTQSFFNSFDLAADASYAGEKGFLGFSGVCHTLPEYITCGMISTYVWLDLRNHLLRRGV